MERDDALAESLRRVTNAALARGALYTLALAGLSAIGIGGLSAAGLVRDLEGPLVFTLVGVGSTVALWLMARRRLVFGWNAYPVLLGYVSLPTLFFLSNEAFFPSGAATYLNGPLAYLYLVLIAVAGAVFMPNLARAAGFVAASGYLLCVLVAMDDLERIHHPDPIVAQDFTNPTIYVLRASMMIAAGFVVAGLAVIARRLTVRAVAEAREKDAVARLFGEYVSEEVKDRLLHSPPSAEGELKEVVVLFSDIRGFTAHSERMAPQELVRRLNQYFDAMARPIHAERGVIDKFVGDAIMAVFGGVIDLPAPCDSAARAAVGMVQALEELNAAWAAQGLEPFHAGIGVHVGEAVQGSIGSAQRKDFTVIGDAVNIASRVEGLTKDGGFAILVTEPVRARLAPELAARCEELGTVPVKGRVAPVSVFGLRPPQPARR